MSNNMIFQSVLTSISDNTSHSSFNEEFCYNLLKKLQSFSYELVEDDIFILTTLILKIERYVKDYCNILHIENNLFDICSNIVCGEFLLLKKSSGQVDFEKDLKSVDIGGTHITYNGNGKNSFDTLVKYLINDSKADLVYYKKVRW